MNLFENLQLMKEANFNLSDYDENDIVTLKISNLASSLEHNDEEAINQYNNWVKDSYDLSVLDYGDTEQGDGYMIIKGAAEDISRFIIEVIGDTSTEVLSIDKFKSTFSSKEINNIIKNSEIMLKNIDDEIDNLFKAFNCQRIKHDNYKYYNESFIWDDDIKTRGLVRFNIRGIFAQMNVNEINDSFLKTIENKIQKLLMNYNLTNISCLMEYSTENSQNMLLLSATAYKDINS